MSEIGVDAKQVIAEIEEEVKKLFTWHALEEMEHQSVCDDIYRYLYGEGIKHKLFYYRTLLTTSQLLLRMIAKIMKQALAQSREPKPGELKTFMVWLMYKPGIGAISTKEFLAFFLPTFEHWKRNQADQQLIKSNLAMLYGASNT